MHLDCTQKNKPLYPSGSGLLQEFYCAVGIGFDIFLMIRRRPVCDPGEMDHHIDSMQQLSVIIAGAAEIKSGQGKTRFSHRSIGGISQPQP